MLDSMPQDIWNWDVIFLGILNLIGLLIIGFIVCQTIWYFLIEEIIEWFKK